MKSKMINFLGEKIGRKNLRKKMYYVENDESNEPTEFHAYQRNFQNGLVFGGAMEPTDHTQAQSLQNFAVFTSSAVCSLL